MTRWVVRRWFGVDFMFKELNPVSLDPLNV